jgi:hypothetical protein
MRALAENERPTRAVNSIGRVVTSNWIFSASKIKSQTELKLGSFGWPHKHSAKRSSHYNGHKIVFKQSKQVK